MTNGTPGHFMIRSGGTGQAPRPGGPTSGKGNTHSEAEEKLFARREERYIEELKTTISDLEKKIEAGEKARNEIGGVRHELKDSKRKITSLEKEIATLQDALALARTQLKEARSKPVEAPQPPTPLPASLAPVVKPLPATNQEKEALKKANATISELKSQLAESKKRTVETEAKHKKETEVLNKQITVLTQENGKTRHKRGCGDLDCEDCYLPSLVESYSSQPRPTPKVPLPKVKVEDRVQGSAKDKEDWKRMVRGLVIHIEMLEISGGSIMEELVKDWGKGIRHEREQKIGTVPAKKPVMKHAFTNTPPLPEPAPVIVQTPATSDQSPRHSELISKLSQTIRNLNDEIFTLRTENTRLLLEST